jgi:hypothetical protein
MSYRPHKRKRATTLKGKCIEFVGNNLHEVFKNNEAGTLDIELREAILEFLCDNPVLVELPEGFLDEAWTKISFGGCVLPRGILSQVGEHCYDLEELDLRQCAGHEVLDIEAFAALCDGCRQLKTVDLGGIMTLKDEQLACLHHLVSSLRRVRLGGSVCLTPAALATFIQRAGKNLQELDLSGCHVNDEVLKAIATHCHNLQELSLGYAEAIAGGIPNAGCTNLGWALLMRNLKKVHTLSLKRVVGAGKPLLLMIARHLGPQLKSLDITGFKEVKADEMVFLLRACPNLEYLNVKNCLQLTPDFLDSAVSTMLRKLKTLDRDRQRVTGCDEEVSKK